MIVVVSLKAGSSDNCIFTDDVTITPATGVLLMLLELFDDLVEFSDVSWLTRAGLLVVASPFDWFAMVDLFVVVSLVFFEVPLLLR